MYEETDCLLDPNSRDALLNAAEEQHNKLVLSWKNLSLQTTSANQTLTLFENLSGFANPGEILAILGQSGSGKSSFLSCLSQRLISYPSSKISGEIYLNQVQCGKYELIKYTSYFSQENVFFDTLTPYETLKFISKLRPKNPETASNEMIKGLLHDLKLEKVMNVKIGNSLNRGISDGEKKRVCIAKILLMDCPVMIMDEPFSGLDSELCKTVMNMFASLKELGKTIVLSVHQPSRVMLNEFNRVIFMSEGRFVFQGPSQDIKAYFEAVGFQFHKQINDIEIIIKGLNIENRNKLNNNELKLIQTLDRSYLKLDIFKYISNKNSEISCIEEDISALTILRTLIWRSRINMIRNPFLLFTKIVHTIMFLCIALPLYYNLGYTSKDIELRKSVISTFCYAVLCFTYGGLAAIIPSEKTIIKSEINEGLYNLTSYFVSKILIELPLQLCYITVMACTVYFQVNLNSEHPKFFIFLGFCYLGIILGVVLAYSMGLLYPSVKLSHFCNSVFTTLMIIFSGVVLNDSSRPKAFCWINYLSPYYYLFRALMINEFEGLEIDEDVQYKPEDRFDLDGNLGVLAVQLGGFCICLLILFLCLIRIRLID